MKVYKFRVLVDHEEDVFRDIVIREDQTFEDLHHAIIKAFGFFGDQMASFYVSNEAWEKGEEIVLMDMGFDGPGAPPVMRTTKIGGTATAGEGKFLYVYDFLRMWIFYVEVHGAEDAVEGANYPLIDLSFGDAPAEDSKEIPDDLGLVDPILAMEEEEELEDEIGDMFDSLEDYDEFM